MFRFFKRSTPVAAPEQDAATADAVDSSADAATSEALVETAPLSTVEDLFKALASETAAEPDAGPAQEPANEPEPAVPAFFDPALAFAEAFEVVAAEKAAAEALRPKQVSLRERLAASSESFRLKLGALFERNPALDEDLLEEIETALLTADVGVAATSELIDGLRARMKKREFGDAHALYLALREQLLALIAPLAEPLAIDLEHKPHVVLVVGVNGAGKTTTIGKLAKHLRLSGASVILAAGDTFRAAAVEQLKVWGDRNGVAVVAQGSGADSASVIYDALQSARARGVQVLIADTAGRLHTQQHLMNELSKVKRVIGKLDASAPHEVLLVLDGTTGQNAINQARQFHKAMGVTGLVVTKLDGSAKGGVIFALGREFKLPIRYIGVGEKLDDLRVFDPAEFVDALLPLPEQGTEAAERGAA